MTGDDRFDYNLRAIRELILAAFSAEELRAIVAHNEECPRQYARFEMRLRTTPDSSGRSVGQGESSRATGRLSKT